MSITVSARMKCVHVISSLCAEGGGPSYTVPRLAEALTGFGWDAEIAALDAPSGHTKGGVMVRTFERDAMPVAPLLRLGRSRAMASGLAGLGGDLLHTHGLWMMPNVYPSRVARREGRPLVLAPRGMLGAEALEFSRFAKRAFWAVWQARAISEVHCFHATAENELEDRGNERFLSLLTDLGLMQRLLCSERFSVSEAKKLLNVPIDYEEVFRRIESRRTISIRFLLGSLDVDYIQ